MTALTAPEPHWIDHPSQLAPLAHALERATWVAIDTEANSLFIYREYVCLLQLNIDGDIWLVDMQALLKHEQWPGLLPPVDAPAAPSRALDALKPGLARTDRTLWIHGGEYDCSLLHRDFDLSLGGVWDTQQAGQMLGFEKTNYGALVERVTGTVLAKEHTQYDWGTRPIDPSAVTYAIDDVRYLPTVGERLRDDIAAADLVEEHALANAAVTGTVVSSNGFEPGGFWRIKGVRDVPRDRLCVLAALYVWRDAFARRDNRPPGRILNNEVVLSLARNAPTNFQLLKRVGLRGRLLAEHGDELMELIRTTLTKPDDYPPPPRHRDVDEAEEERETRLKDWRRSEAERRKVPLLVVLPAKALDHLKRHGADGLTLSTPQLGAKRLAAYGDKLRELCR